MNLIYIEIYFIGKWQNDLENDFKSIFYFRKQLFQIV